MAAGDRDLKPIEFQVTRIPQVRVIFGEYESCLVQVLGDGRPLHIRGTEHDLWRFFRTILAETVEPFAEQAVERARSQTLRMGSLDERVERLTRELESAKEQLRIERGVRDGVEKALVRRDGPNRAASEVAEFRGEVE